MVERTFAKAAGTIISAALFTIAQMPTKLVRKLQSGVLVVMGVVASLVAPPVAAEALAATTVSRVSDINPGSADAFPSGTVSIGTSVYFNARDGVNGIELWKSSGTAAGTVIVKDINPGSGSSVPSALTNIDGVLYFFADDAVHGAELWKSDGTAAGTVMVKDINPNGDSYPSNFTLVNRTIYFGARGTGQYGMDLWKTDGTANGTQKVDVGASVAGPLRAYNGSLLFWAGEAQHGRELWKVDSAGLPSMVKDINPGVADGMPLPAQGFTQYGREVNGTFMLNANDGEHGVELWKSNGTAAGTVMVKDVQPGSDSSNPRFVTSTSVLYFSAMPGAPGAVELWTSDGTSDGTVGVSSSVFPSGTDELGTSPTSAGNLNGLALFQGWDSVHGSELWRSDGTSAGTYLVKDGRPGTAGSAPSSLSRLGTKIFFAAVGPDGSKAWETDGTEAGTAVVSGSPEQVSDLAVLGDSLFFSGVDGFGKELWKLTDSPDLNAPTGVQATSPTQLPVLGWSAVNLADHYNVYRDGSIIGSTSMTDYTDSSATNGSHTYEVTAVDLLGNESAKSASITVLVDKTAPVIMASAKTVDGADYTAETWTNQTVAVHFTCLDSLSGVASCPADVAIDANTPAAGTPVTGTARDNAGNSSTTDAILVKVDKTAPTLGPLTWTANPLLEGQSTTLSVAATDDLSGVNVVAYTLDGGHPQAMAFDSVSNTWRAVLGTNPALSVNTYNIEVFTTDEALNESARRVDVLAVYNTTNGYVAGHGRLTPNATDTMPIARDVPVNPGQRAGQLVTGFTNVVAPISGNFDVSYVVKNNEDEFRLSSTEVNWVIVPDATHARILGHANLTKYVNGVQSTLQNVAVKFELALGTGGAPDHITIKIFEPDVDPNSGTPTWVISDNADVSSIRIHR